MPDDRNAGAQQARLDPDTPNEPMVVGGRRTMESTALNPYHVDDSLVSLGSLTRNRVPPNGLRRESLIAGRWNGGHSISVKRENPSHLATTACDTGASGLNVRQVPV